MTRRHAAAVAAILLGLILTFAISISGPSPVQAQVTSDWNAQYYTGDLIAGTATPVNGSTAVYPATAGVLTLTYPNFPRSQTGVEVPGIPEDNWSVRLISTFTISQPGTYQFTLTADDKARLIDLTGTEVVRVDTPGQVSSNAQLLGTGAYTYTVEWHDIIGNASLTLTWQLVNGGGGGVGTPVGPTATPQPTATVTRTPLPPIPAGALTGTVIRASVLNIRDAPSLGGNRIGRILRGETYAVVGRDQDARWFLLQLGGYQGWAYGYYLFFNFNEFTAPITSGNAVLGLAGQPDTGVRVQARATVRLRQLPTVGSMQTGRITWGAFLPVVGRTADGFWYQVVWRGTVGWAYSPFLDILAGDLNNVPVTFP